MKIAYIPQNNPYDKHSWSGTDYYVRKALEEQGLDVYCIYGFKPKYSLKDKVVRFWSRITRKRYDLNRTRNVSRQYAEFITSRLKPDTDIIFSLGTVQVAMLEVNIPIVIYVDGIFEQMRKFYKWNDLSISSIKESNLVEQTALDNCHDIVSCSIETANAIKKYYKIDENKMHIVPLGANWDYAPDKEKVIEGIKYRDPETCHILFVGVEWQRKGADIVLDTTKILHERGFSVHLDFCGLKSVPVKLPAYVTNYGFLNKDKPQELALLEKLYLNSHFLFVPSRAEAYGLVFCEASAYGLPSISFREGGLTTIVKDDVNGKLFDLTTKPDTFASYIIDTFNDKRKYNKLCLSSIERYNQLLNWGVAGLSLKQIIANAVECDNNLGNI